MSGQGVGAELEVAAPADDSINVRMGDGTLLKGVPGGWKQGQIVEWYSRNKVGAESPVPPTPAKELGLSPKPVAPDPEDDGISDDTSLSDAFTQGLKKGTKQLVDLFSKETLDAPTNVITKGLLGLPQAIATPLAGVYGAATASPGEESKDYREAKEKVSEALSAAFFDPYLPKQGELEKSALRAMGLPFEGYAKIADLLADANHPLIGSAIEATADLGMVFAPFAKGSKFQPQLDRVKQRTAGAVTAEIPKEAVDRLVEDSQPESPQQGTTPLVETGQDAADFLRLQVSKNMAAKLDGAKILDAAEKADLTAADRSDLMDHIEDPSQPISPKAKAFYDQHLKLLQEAQPSLYQRVQQLSEEPDAEGYAPRMSEDHPVVQQWRALEAGRKPPETAGVGAGGGGLSKTPSLKGKRTMMALEAVDGSEPRKIVSLDRSEGSVTEWNAKQPKLLGKFTEPSLKLLRDKEIKPLRLEQKMLKTERRAIKKASEYTQEKFDTPIRQIRRGKINRRLGAIDRQINQIMNRHPPEELKNRLFRVGKKNYRLVDATRKEIEQHTDVKYYPDYVKSLVHTFVDLVQRKHAWQAVEHLKASPLFKQFAAEPGSKRTPAMDDWRGTTLPQFRGWLFDPRTAEVLDDFHTDMNKDANMVSALSSFLISGMMMNPMPHMRNEGSHFWTGVGVTGNISRALHPGRTLNVILRGWKDALEASPEYLEVMRNGGMLMNGPLKLRQLHQPTMMAAIRAALSDPRAGSWMKRLGIPPAVIARGISDASGTVMWTSSAAMKMAYVHEMAARRGVTIAEASRLTRQQLNALSKISEKSLPEIIKETEHHLPPYYLPSRVLGSRALSKFLQDHDLVSFSRYHFGLFHSYMHSLTTLFNPSMKVPLKARMKAFDHLAAIGIFTFVIYPQVMDRIARAITGNPNAMYVRPGSLRIPYLVNEIFQGKEPLTHLLGDMITPGLGTTMFLNLWQNNDPFKHQPIYQEADVTKNPARAAGDLAAWVGWHVSPFSWVARLADEKSQQDFNTRSLQFAFQQIGIKSPTKDQLNKAAYFKSLRERQAVQRMDKDYQSELKERRDEREYDAADIDSEP